MNAQGATGSRDGPARIIRYTVQASGFLLLRLPLHRHRQRTVTRVSTFFIFSPSESPRH